MTSDCLALANALLASLNEAERVRDLVKITYAADAQSLVITEGAEVVNQETGEGIEVDTIPGAEITPSLDTVQEAIKYLYNLGGADLASVLSYVRTATQAQVDELAAAFDEFECLDVTP